METLKEVLVLFGYALIAYVMSTAIHEGGHVICGLMHRWKLLMIVVGPFKLYRENKDDKIHFGIEKNPTLWGGVGGTFPKEVNKSVTKVFARILLAGPMASIILGVTFIIILVFTKSDLAMMIGFVALGQGIACILPMNIKTGILYNDGTRCKRILQGGKTLEEEEAILNFTYNTFLNGEKEQYDNELVDVLLDSSDASYRYYGLYYRYLNAKTAEDKSEMERIKEDMNLLGSKVSSFVRQSCAVE